MEYLKLSLTNVIHASTIYVYIILLIYLLNIILFLILMLTSGLTTLLEPRFPSPQLILYFFSRN